MPSLLSVHVELDFNTHLTTRDRQRLGPHITNYNRLNELLVLNGLALVDIKKLILLELEGKKRTFILRKLVGRLKNKERRQLLNLISTCVKVTSKPKLSDTPKVGGVSCTNSRRHRNGASPIAS